MKWLHHLLRGVSLTAALFVFQACYGSPQIPKPDEMDMDAVEVRSDAASEEEAGAEVAETAAETVEDNG